MQKTPEANDHRIVRFQDTARLSVLTQDRGLAFCAPRHRRCGQLNAVGAHLATDIVGLARSGEKTPRDAVVRQGIDSGFARARRTSPTR